MINTEDESGNYLLETVQALSVSIKKHYELRDNVTALIDRVSRLESQVNTINNVMEIEDRK